MAPSLKPPPPPTSPSNGNLTLVHPSPTIEDSPSLSSMETVASELGERGEKVQNGADNAAEMRDRPPISAERVASGQREAPVGTEESPCGPSEDELRRALYPPDSYVEVASGQYVYWADLEPRQRAAWACAQFNAEARREMMHVARMARRSPLAPLRAYFRNYVATGLGLFVEGYVLFSVSNLQALFKIVWPQCWANHEVCNKLWIDSVEYLEIVGIICGQIIVGIEADWLGRRFGMIQDAVIMTLGTILLTAMWGSSLNAWVVMYAWSLFVYGIGVGGEYPSVSTRSLERSAVGSSDDRLHRGRNIGLAFTQQGMGQLFNQGLLIVFLAATNSGRLHEPISKAAAQWTFRLSFAVVLVPTLALLYQRVYRLRDADAALRQAKDALGEGSPNKPASSYDVASLKLALRHDWHRLLATGGCWFVSDFLFYGSRLFSSVFIQEVTGSPNDLQSTWLYNLLNVGVSLVGYFAGALLVDHKLYGRRRMQFVGLFVLFILFLLCAALYPYLTQKGAGIRAFMALYFLSSFFTQLGPNITTFMLAAEIYPASIRATAHGFSAACGKLGALAPAILYNYIDVRTRFWIVCWFGLAGAVLTLVFVPDTCGLELEEQERSWRARVSASRGGDGEQGIAGHVEAYHGVALHPRHLSWFERSVLGRHREYDPVRDDAARRRAAIETWRKKAAAAARGRALGLREKQSETPAGAGT